MSIFSRIVRFLTGDNEFETRRNERGKLVSLRWQRDRFPIAVYVDGDLPGLTAILTNIIRDYNALARIRLFQFPVEAIPETVEQFDDEKKRQFVRSACLVRVSDSIGSLHGDTTLNYDTRNGEIFNALVVVSANVTMWTETILRHELGHVLGLADDDGNPDTIMHRHVAKSDAKLTESDISTLRKAYSGSPVLSGAVK